MVVEYFLMILTTLESHFTDVVVVLAIVALFIYQRKEAKKTTKNTEQARNACDRMEKESQKTIPSVSSKMKEVVKNSATMNRELDKILWKVDADRGWIYLFHNSGYDFLGQPFAKITNTNESLTPGTPSLMSIMKDVPIGSMACFIEYLLENGEIRIPDIREFREKDKTVYSCFNNLGIKSTYSVMLFAPRVEESDEFTTLNGEQSKEGIPLGIIGVGYLKDYVELSDEEFECVYDSAMVIKGLLLQRRKEEIEDEEIVEN